MKYHPRHPVSLLLLLFPVVSQLCLAQNSAFTYQGRLLDSGQPANGSYDIRVALTDALNGGNQIGTALTNAPVPVSNGLFVVVLDFGGGAFDGSARWLEIGVRTNGSSSSYALLSPRQAITATPYAILAAAATTATVATNLVPGAAIIADGAGITNLNGACIQVGTISSNQLDSATSAQLALAGTRGGRNLTNTILRDAIAPRYLEITNQSASSGAIASNRLYLRFTASNTTSNLESSLIGWAGLYQDDFAMNWWPTHGGANGLAPEMVFTCRGSIAIGTGWNDANAQYRGLQIGVGENHHPWVYMQCENIRPFNTNLTTSVPVLFNARYYSNGIPYMVGSGQPYSGWSKLPGMWGEATTTNGNGAISFFDAFDTYYASWNNNTNPRFQVLVSPSDNAGGIAIRGGITINGATGLTTNYTIRIGDTLSVSNGIVVGITSGL